MKSIKRTAKRIAAATVASGVLAAGAVALAGAARRRHAEPRQRVGTTTINGVNDFGQVVGFWVDANGNTDGFLAAPQR